MTQYLLGTDNGSTMAKAALFALDGREVAVAGRKVELASPRPDFVEVDMDRSWAAACEAIREVLERSGVDPRQIACVASTGHGNGAYLIDSRGQPACRAFSSMDSRGRPYIERWQAAGVDRAVRPKTMQGLWAGQPNAILAWLAEHRPEVLRNTSAVLMCKDYIRFRMTGEIQAELTDMSGTSLMDVGAGQYDDDLLDAFGLRAYRRLLPPLVRSADLCGKVTAEAAATTGLAEGTPVAGGLFDIDACALACGLVDEGPLCMVAGTWGCNLYVSPRPVVDDVFMTSCYAMPGLYLMLEGSPTSAANLEWFVSRFFAAERESMATAGRSVFDLCNELVARTAPDDSRIVFLPYLYGSNGHPDAKGCFVGLNHRHERGHVLRAIYEGVAFAHRQHVDRLLRFRAMPERIRLSGGAARSKPWVEIFADLFQLPVEIPAATELGALGAAITAAVAVGAHPSFDAAVRAMVRFDQVQTPHADRGEHYEEKYARYQQVAAALDSVW